MNNQLVFEVSNHRIMNYQRSSNSPTGVESEIINEGETLTDAPKYEPLPKKNNRVLTLNPSTTPSEHQTKFRTNVISTAKARYVLTLNLCFSGETTH